MELRTQRMPLAERSSKMYILPTPTHLEVVALGDSSDILFFRHFNCELNGGRAGRLKGVSVLLFFLQPGGKPPGPPAKCWVGTLQEGSVRLSGKGVPASRVLLLLSKGVPASRGQVRQLQEAAGHEFSSCC